MWQTVAPRLKLVDPLRIPQPNGRLYHSAAFVLVEGQASWLARGQAG